MPECRCQKNIICCGLYSNSRYGTTHRAEYRSAPRSVEGTLLSLSNRPSMSKLKPQTFCPLRPTMMPRNLCFQSTAHHQPRPTRRSTPSRFSLRLLADLRHSIHPGGLFPRAPLRGNLPLRNLPLRNLPLRTLPLHAIPRHTIPRHMLRSHLPYDYQHRSLPLYNLFPL